MNYLPHTPEDIKKALETIGVENVEALFADIPAQLQNPEVNIPAGKNEAELMAHLQQLASKNKSNDVMFLGGGTQRHFIPSVTPHLAMQSEFVTAYTPYQAEVAQGFLQATFEYQTMMSELTGLPISNASMYDGASSVAEAALLAVRQTKRNTVLVSKGVHPETREVLATYMHALRVEIVTVEFADADTPHTQVEKISAHLNDNIACVIVQNPNFLGYLEPMQDLVKTSHEAGALFIAATDPLSLILLEAPGNYGADIVVGEGQTLGNPSNLGGPSFGFMTVTQKLLRQLPGRLVGETKDANGKRAFTLTLQAREQHIRRSRAKSNICSNHQLAALMATVNISALGAKGLQRIAEGSVRAAHVLAQKLVTAGATVWQEQLFFNEFVVKVNKNPQEVRHQLAEKGIHAGVPVPSDYGLGNALVLAATEMNTDADMELLVQGLEPYLNTTEASS